MTISERRPVSGPGRPGVPGGADSAAILDRLVRTGRITAGQAAQYRIWEAARPPLDGGRQRFDAWMASRPNIPGMPSISVPGGDRGRMAVDAQGRPVLTSVPEAKRKPEFPSQETGRSVAAPGLAGWPAPSAGVGGLAGRRPGCAS